MPMLGALLILPMLVGQPADSIDGQSHYVDEVVVVSAKAEGRKRSAKGQVASIDEHLSELAHVNLVRRGSYAWEPVVNGMRSERVSTTIDGMKIFYACTDKMDPVTSYVESGNLQSISLNSGLDGNPQSTGNIGGSLDLRLRKVGFDREPFALNVSTGYEANGNLQVYGADAAVSSHRFYSNFGAFYRHAGNYRAGGDEEVAFSQFQKVNAFANVGYRLAERQLLEGTVIYDCATDVGYPALNMDVAKAEGFISSLSYKRLFSHPLLSSWETKAYYNHITHTMDDTHRPDVEIHMDMPGKSWTGGLYSLLALSGYRHDAQINYDLYYNRLFADMTMYPGGAAPMYMITWPDVGTLNTGFALTDNISLPHNGAVRLSAKLAWQWQKLNSEEGYKALSVFFPGMRETYHQTVGRIAASYAWQPDHWRLSVGTGWGSRAPTVTEAYGYYLNNTFDQYDYIGNPRLKNESAVELNGLVKWMPTDRLSLAFDANAFFFSNYIIGEFEERLSPMTVAAEGVKVYGNIGHATIANLALTAQLRHLTLADGWEAVVDGQLNYSLGRDADGDPLPLISPLAYASNLELRHGAWQLRTGLKGNAWQVDYGAKYGETETPAFAIVHVSALYALAVSDVSITLRAGVENLFDKNYSSYSDWCKIPQKGRNIYINLALEL